MSEWKEISLHDIKGIKIGHAQDTEHATGCTVILPDKKAICGVDVRGGGPASRENQLLNPLMSNDGSCRIYLPSSPCAANTSAIESFMKRLSQSCCPSSFRIPFPTSSAFWIMSWLAASVRWKCRPYRLSISFYSCSICAYSAALPAQESLRRSMPEPTMTRASGTVLESNG